LSKLALLSALEDSTKHVFIETLMEQP